MKALIYCLLLPVLFITSCATTAQYNDPIPVHDSLSLQSKILGELRTINVWLPPEYKTGTDSFPVLYMPDGGIVKEDFPHIANTLAELIASKKIKPIILVGIQNTNRKRDLTGPTLIEKDKEISPEVGGSANFRAFITDELMPEINNKYRTNSTKGIIGESLAGLFVMETLMRKPETFNFYIAFDPSLWWNDHDVDKNAKTYLENLPNSKITLWFATSSAGGMQGAGQNLEKVMQDIPVSKLVWKYSDEPKEKHNTIFRATKVKAITWTLNNAL